MGPCQLNNGVITLISRVITPVTHWFSAFYRGPMTPLTTASGAHRVGVLNHFLAATGKQKLRRYPTGDPDRLCIHISCVVVGQPTFSWLSCFFPPQKWEGQMNCDLELNNQT